MKKAIGIARKSTGNYDKAYAQIEKIKKGLADEDIIAHVLKKANESVEIEEGFRVVGVTTSGEKFKSGILKTQKDADNKHWKLTKATDLRGKKVYKTLKVVKESVELDEGANLQIFKDSGYMMQRNGKGSTFTIFYGKKAVAHGQSKGGKVNPATVNKNTTLTWTIPSKNNMTTPLSGVDAVKYLKKNLIESVELDEAYDRGSIRDFKVGDKVKFVDDKSIHHGQTGKITKLIGGIAARQKAHVKLDKTKKTVIDILTSTDLIKESVDLDEGFSLSKKGQYDLQVVGKTTVGVTLSLRHKGKQIITGTKKDGMFIMAFEKHNERNKLPKGAEIVKKGKWMHIGFKKADDVIAYAKSQGFVADMKGINEAVERKSFKELRGLIEAKAKGFVGAVRNEKYSMALLIDGVDERDGTRGTRDAMDKIKAFQKTAKKTYAGAKGKGTIPAVKKEIKLQGATQYYAKWQSDSSSYKDDSVEIWFTK